ncbi:MAG TPA: ABC transporter permease [Stellaceae bacterium]|nr:ABC transporter permease [Stellaceae bacterium]
MRKLAGLALLLPPLLVFLGFFVGPLLYLFYVSLHASSQSELYGAGFTAANYAAILTDPFYRRILERTLATTLEILGLSLVIGYAAAFTIAGLPPRRRLFCLVLLLFPLMVSNVVRAYGWVALLGRRGVLSTALRDAGIIDRPLTILYTTDAVVIGLLTILLPYMIISIANALASIDRAYGEAAQALGAGPVRRFLHVTLPLSSPGIASGMLLVFLLTLSAYVTVTLLGGPQSKMLVSLVYDGVVAFDWPRAAALAFTLLAAALLAAAIILAALRPRRVAGRG